MGEIGNDHRMEEGTVKDNDVPLSACNELVKELGAAKSTAPSQKS
jgi:hypothetical protein